MSSGGTDCISSRSVCLSELYFATVQCIYYIMAIILITGVKLMIKASSDEYMFNDSVLFAGGVWLVYFFLTPTKGGP